MQHNIEGKDKLPHNTQMEIKNNKENDDHQEKKHGSAAKHTRRREGHMDTYGAGHTNADHPDYWKKDKTGVTPKSKEVAADKETKKTTTTDKKSKTTMDKSSDQGGGTEKKKKNILQKLVGKFKERGKEIKEKRKNQKKVLKNPFNPSQGYEWVDK